MSDSEKKTTNDQGLAHEVMKCVGDACKGMARDMRKWEALPGKSMQDKASIVFTNEGRLPWLVLIFSVCFFVFYALSRALSPRNTVPARFTKSIPPYIGY